VPCTDVPGEVDFLHSSFFEQEHAAFSVFSRSDDRGLFHVEAESAAEVAFAGEEVVDRYRKNLPWLFEKFHPFCHDDNKTEKKT